MLIGAEVGDRVEHRPEPVVGADQRLVAPHGRAARLEGDHATGREHRLAALDELQAVQPVVLAIGVVGPLVGQVDDHDVVALRRRMVEEAPAVGVVQLDRPVTLLDAGEFLGAVAVRQVLGTDAHALLVDVDVVDPAGAGGHGHLAGHALAGADDQHPLDPLGEQERRHHHRLVVDQLGELGALPVVVAEQRDALPGAGDDHVLVGGVALPQHLVNPPQALQVLAHRFLDPPVPVEFDQRCSSLIRVAR